MRCCARAGAPAAHAAERRQRSRLLLAFPPAPAPVAPGGALSSAAYSKPTGAPAGEAAPSIAGKPFAASAFAVPAAYAPQAHTPCLALLFWAGACCMFCCAYRV